MVGLKPIYYIFFYSLVETNGNEIINTVNSVWIHCRPIYGTDLKLYRGGFSQIVSINGLMGILLKRNSYYIPTNYDGYLNI